MTNQLIEEIYTPMKEFTLYAISNYGNIVHMKENRMLYLSTKKLGYKQVILYKRHDERSTHQVHRLVAMNFIDNPKNMKIVDHIDNNPENNREDNLRWCSSAQNSYNTKIPKTNTSGVKGVSQNKNKTKWLAQIKFEGKSIHIGSFKTIQEATEARQKKANELFGEFANSCEKT